jgi:hypothetical protein
MSMPWNNTWNKWINRSLGGAGRLAAVERPIRQAVRIGGRPPKLKPQQRLEIVKLVKKGKKTAADAALLFGVRPATVSRLLQRA